MTRWIERTLRAFRVKQAETNGQYHRGRRMLFAFLGFRAQKWTVAQAIAMAWLGLMPNLAGGDDTTVSTLSSDMISAYIADKTLMVAEKQTRLAQLGEKASLPSRNSKTFQYSRYDRINLPQAPLTEGVTPASTQMSVSTVTAVVEQWGQVVVITDMAELVIKHAVVQKGINLLGLSAAETRDREVQETLLAGTNTQYVNNRAGRATLVAGDVLTTNEIREALANLRGNGAGAFDGGGNYVGLFDPSVEMDVSADPTFVQAMQYSKIENLLEGEVGKWMGVRWLRSNFLYTYLGAAVHSTAEVVSGGSIPAATGNVYTVVTGVSDTTGFEQLVTQEDTQAITSDGNNTHIVRVTAPSTAGYTYNIYAGTVSGTTYQVTTGVLPSATYDVTSVPTSGTQNPAIPGSGVTTHTVWVFGKESFAVVNLDGMSLQTYVTPRGATDSDPLEQRRKIGWKMAFKACIQNNNFFRRIECTTNF